MQKKIDKKEILESLENLAESIIENQNKVNNVGFLGGQSGLAFFLLMYSDYSGNIQCQEKGYEIIEEIISSINSGVKFQNTFCSGLAGYGWMLEYLNQKEIIDIDTDDILADLDIYLFEHMCEYYRNGAYDFLHGGGGILLYFLRRYEGDSIYKENLAQYIGLAIGLLHEHCIIDDKGYRWKSIIDYQAKKVGFNISLSHGLSSICMLLVRIIQNGINVEECTKILEGTQKYIKSQAQDPTKFKSYFPTFTQEETESRNSRLGWCYGDLGVSNTLRASATLLEDKSTSELATKAITHTKNRLDIKDNSVNDACICHGSAGLALFAILEYQLDNSSTNKELIDYWVDITLKMGNRNDSSGKYLYNKFINDEYIWDPEINFLEGDAGVGMVLLSYLDIENCDLDWKESLLL